MKKRILLYTTLLILTGSIQSFAQDTLKLTMEPQTCSLLLNNSPFSGTIQIKGRTTVLSLQNRSGLASNALTIAIRSDNADPSNLAPNRIPENRSKLQMIILPNGMLENSILLGTAVTITVIYKTDQGNIRFTMPFKTDLPAIAATEVPPGEKAPLPPGAIHPTGIAYYDALLLDSLFRTNDISAVLRILSHYKNGKNLVNNKDSVLRTFGNNPYLREQIEKNWDRIYGTSLQASGFISDLAGPISAIGGVNVTDMADGIARFMVERMKEELSASFFDRFKAVITDPRYNDMGILFPRTSGLLTSMDQDIFDYSLYLSSMRQAFATDMANQYTNLQKLLNQQKYKDYFLRERPDLGSILYSSLYIIDQLSAGKHPGDVLKGFAPDIRINLRDSIVQADVRSSVKLLQIVSASLQSRSGSHYWITADSVRTMVEKEQTFKLYLGLIYEQADGLCFTTSDGRQVYLQKVLDTLYTSIRIARTELNAFRNFVEVFSDRAEEVNQALDELKDKKRSDINYTDYYALFTAFLDLMEHSIKVVDLPYINLGDSIEQRTKNIAAKWIYVARASGNLYVDTRTKNYSSAIWNAVNILDTLLAYDAADAIRTLKAEYESTGKTLDGLLKTSGSNKSSTVSKVINTIDLDKVEDQKITWPLVQNDFSAVLNTATITDEQKALIIKMVEQRRDLFTARNKDRLRQYILRYGAFISAVAQAQNSTEVKEAIEAAVLPAGSARIKRETAFNVALNGYVGFFYGYEHINNVDHDGIREINFRFNKWNSYGITAPIGISVNLGKQHLPPLSSLKQLKGHTSHSLFISIVDIGALAAFRLPQSNDSIARVPNVQLKDIISPGIFYSVGFAKCPFSLNAGYQVGPLLREVGSQANTFGLGYSRFSISLCVDIPMFNLYTSTR